MFEITFVSIRVESWLKVIMMDSTVAERSALVKDASRRAGFDACGVAAAGPVDPEDCLGQWLERGFHADMTWLAETRDVRRDVQRKLPGTRSVVVVARNYYTPDTTAPSGTGRVARYARGRDYHRALRKPLYRLARYIETLEPGARTYCCIDSGPVMEKAWAVRAGVGWLGKNSLVLRRDLGSWFFLAVILTTVELAPDGPVPDQCGSCTACLDACPTDAIVAPQVVDSRRCISYHTIENRGNIPEDLQPAFGDWVFGCDICQDVCPWNRRAGETTERDFIPRPGHAFPELEPLAEMDNETFRETYSGSPIMRAKAAGMRRNAQIALANRSGSRAGHS
jgi:epoxyqueuosine reductase